jgi:FAD dependent oxidoreductase TIGR03364
MSVLPASCLRHDEEDCRDQVLTTPFKVDVAIVGAGIVGMAHAYLAARAGRSVAVFERNPAAQGASIRNFGMIRPIGQVGDDYKLALRSRNLWIEILQQAKLPYFDTGSLLAAYSEDEAAVGLEFSLKAPSLGYDCTWLSAQETLVRTHALRHEGLLGALRSPTEVNIDPRQVVREFPGFLAANFGVRFYFNTSVLHVEPGTLRAPNLLCHASSIIIAGGDDFQTLFPECFRDSGLTRCKLQMMRTVPQPDGWRLGPSLAFGLSFRHYPALAVCDTLTPLKHRIESEAPELDRFGIHVMVSQAASGELTIGDSHEYARAVNVFDNTAINRLIFDFARDQLCVPTLEIAEQWHGVYAKHPSQTWLCLAPADGIRIITFTSGIGITMCFGVAEQTLLEMGEIA